MKTKGSRNYESPCSYLSDGLEIGWKERLRHDLYCVKWDVQP